jgi:peptide deformylase
MAPFRIRTFGDPVLKRRAEEVTEIDGRIAHLAEDMHATMKEARGLGLAAPQVGVGRRLFVYEIGESGPRTVINPVMVETDGEWEHEEGCLSVPGLYFRIVRPKRVHMKGLDLDHLDGRLLLELLDDDQRKTAMRELRRRSESEGGAGGQPST